MKEEIDDMTHPEAVDIDDEEFLPLKHPTRINNAIRFERLFGHVLQGLLTGASPKDSNKIVERAYLLADQADKLMEARRTHVD